MVKQFAVNEAVGKLAGDAARLGLRPTDHATSISDDVKASFQKGIDLLEEGEWLKKKQRRSVCTCAANLSRRYTRTILVIDGWSA